MAKRYDWGKIVATARRSPRVWVLAATAVPTRTAETVNERRLEELELDDGELRGEIRNHYRDDENRPRGDLFVTFIPKETNP